MKSRRPSGRQFVLSGCCFFFFFFFFGLLCILTSINEVLLQSLYNFGRLPFPALSANAKWSIDSHIIENSSSNDTRILLGVLTLPNKYERRQLLRLAYGTQSVAGAKIDVKFVFCNVTKDDERFTVALEIMRYDDIIILNCTESMNEGKTYTYFSSLPEMLNGSDRSDPPYHYVVKADDDTYFRFQALVDSLANLPREDLYYGFVIPCESMDPFKHYMAGMGYLVSWDIVEWVRSSDIPKQTLKGPEDKVFGQWLRDGRRGQNRYNAKWSMYNYPSAKADEKCSHELWPGTIAVHLLKTREMWIDTLSFFNVTQNLKTSKLY
ncbi:hypothetical protein Vadar_011303 [Vaccinium darrowii]|uniref:Uncharacterized protein n=1 Tax=Vaccinium darrowii TaxID=229202 RepID=A0ACB7YLB6_9ERIC|nr:hypothetical protein Vadar_011303 [Vaccinium darrowii]